MLSAVIPSELGYPAPTLGRITFYPLSDGASTHHRQITKTRFRACSTCLSHSQAPLCLYTRTLISNQREETFAHLRYLLGGDRPSQTARLTLSTTGLHQWS